MNFLLVYTIDTLKLHFLPLKIMIRKPINCHASLGIIFLITINKLRMNEQEKNEVIKELVDHNGNKIELVKKSVYQEDKLIVLLLNIRRMGNPHLYMATAQRNLLMLWIIQSLKILYYFIRINTMILILLVLKSF